MPRARRETTTFSSAMTNSVENAIRKLANRQFYHAKQAFSFHDLKLMFIPRNQRQLVTEAFAMAAPTGTTFDLNTSFMDHDITLQFRWRWDASGGFLIPHGIGGGLDPVQHLQEDCPDALGERYLQMLRDFTNTSLAFGLVMHTFGLLNEQVVCKRPEYMRYYWPCIVPLLETMGDHEKSVADLLRRPDRKAAGRVTMTEELTGELLQMSNNTVAAAMLVEAIAAPVVPVEYGISVQPKVGTIHGLGIS